MQLHDLMSMLVICQSVSIYKFVHLSVCQFQFVLFSCNKDQGKYMNFSSLTTSLHSGLIYFPVSEAFISVCHKPQTGEARRALLQLTDIDVNYYS